MEMPDDGLVFDPQTLQAEWITEDADYEGIRVLFQGKLDSAIVHMQVASIKPFPHRRNQLLDGPAFGLAVDDFKQAVQRGIPVRPIGLAHRHLFV